MCSSLKFKLGDFLCFELISTWKKNTSHYFVILKSLAVSHLKSHYEIFQSYEKLEVVVQNT